MGTDDWWYWGTTCPKHIQAEMKWSFLADGNFKLIFLHENMHVDPDFIVICSQWSS